MTLVSQPFINPFVGREREQEVYQQLLAASTATPWMLVVTGQGGNGKSTLLGHLTGQTPEQFHVVSLNFAQPSLRLDPLNILTEISWKLTDRCDAASVEAFDRALQDGRSRLAEISRQQNQFIFQGDSASLQGAQLQMSSDAAALREQQRQVREQVTGALYRQVLAFQHPGLVFMLDTCEWLSEPEGLELGSWMFDELLPGIRERLLWRQRRCVAVIASRVPPRLSAIERQDYRSLVLQMLEQEAVENYFTQIGLHDSALRERIYRITHGHALCVSIIGVLWQERDDRPFTLADLPELQEQFNQRALMEFISERLDRRLKSPYRELSRYGVLLRRFNLPLLQALFPDLLPEAEALDRFHALIRYPYIEAAGNGYFAFHPLLREIQAAEVRDQQPDLWRTYHRRALDELSRTAPNSPDWYYHALVCNEQQAMSDWWDVVQTARNRGQREQCGALLEAVHDETLKLTPLSMAERAFQQGRFDYYWTSMQAALASYQQALDLFRQVGSRLGEANVLQAIGGVQRLNDEYESALESYKEALILYAQVGDRLGEANCYLSQGRIALAQGDHQRALSLHDDAHRLYGQIQDLYSQVRLLYYRSFVYEAMDEKKLAIEDVEKGLVIALPLALPLSGSLERRLEKLKGQ